MKNKQVKQMIESIFGVSNVGTTGFYSLWHNGKKEPNSYAFRQYGRPIKLPKVSIQGRINK